MASAQVNETSVNHSATDFLELLSPGFKPVTNRTNAQILSYGCDLSPLDFQTTSFNIVIQLCNVFNDSIFRRSIFFFCCCRVGWGGGGGGVTQLSLDKLESLILSCSISLMPEMYANNDFDVSNVLLLQTEKSVR